MTPTEFRILSEIALVALAMLPVGLVYYASKRRAQPPVVAEPVAVQNVSDESVPQELATDAPLFLVPPPKPYRFGGADLVMGMVLVLLLGLITFLPKGMDVNQPVNEAAKQALPPLSAGLIFMSLILTQGMQLGIIWAWFRTRMTSMAEAFGIRRYSVAKSMSLAGIMIVPAAIISMGCLLIMLYVLAVMGWPQEQQEAVKMFSEASDLPVKIALAIGACVGAPIVEECLFRGVLYRSTRELTSKWFAIIFSSLIFAVIHLHLPSLPALFMLGLFFALAYETTGSLLVPILMHSIFNTVQVIAALHGAK